MTRAEKIAKLRQLEQLKAVKAKRVAAHQGKVTAAGDAQRAQIAKDNAAIDSADGMSTAAKLGAGMVSGLLNVGQGAADMLPFVDYSEEIAERKRLEEDLSDTTAGSVGQFGGEMLGLAPLGVIGAGAKGVQGARAASQGAPKLTKALSSITAPVTAAATEGAVGGAILADSGERLEGAGLGATGGVLLNKTMAGINRVLNKGITKVTPDAAKLADTVEVLTGKRPHIPVAMAGDVRDNISSKGVGAARDAITMLPSAKAGLINQADNLMADVNEATLRKIFQTKPDGTGTADLAVSIFKETGDMNKAVKSALASKKSAPNLNQQVLLDATHGQSKGVYTPKMLRKSVEKVADRTGTRVDEMPLYDFANMVEGVAGRPISGTSMAGKDAYRSMDNTVSSIPGMLGLGIDSIPLLNIGKVLSSERLAKSMMGQHPIQRGFRRVMDTPVGDAAGDIGAAVRRTLGAQLSQESDSPIYEEYVTKLRGLR
jgi:hypothetical protein